MISEEFKKIYKNLNAAQKEAVDFIEGAVMVIAGPGTGKTQILTLRIANILLRTQINPENILALTFTEAASFEMRKRLLSIIGNDAYRVEITTFHSFCNNLIKQYQEEFAHIIASVNINEIEQLQIIEECLNSLNFKILRPLGDTNYYLKPLLNVINELKRENISPESLRNALEDYKKNLDLKEDLYHEKGVHKGKIKSIYQKSYKDYEKNKELLLVFEAYQKKLFENKKYDYNDMLLEVIKKLTNNQYLLTLLQEKFQYFLVDEHQDTNASQNKIIELLCNYFENPNLFVVGDEKQAIFRFQGATLENFLYFKKLYSDAKLVKLSENYRSTQTILNATHSIILNNPKLDQILLQKGGLLKKSLHKEEKIKVIGLTSLDLEYYWVAQEIKTILESGKHEIAVLARNNKDLDHLVLIFDSFKIPYIMESDRNILDDLDVQKLILLFRVVLDPTKNRNEYVKKAMLLDCFKIQPLDVFKLIHKAYEKKTSIWEIINNEKLLEKLLIKSRKEIKDFAALFIDEEKGLIKKAMNDKLDRVFVETLNSTGLMKKILEKPHAQEILNRIKQLYDEVGKEIKKNPLFSLSDFIKYIDLLEENNISLKQSAHIIPENVVRLMTVHKSKGLEFDYVFVINAYDGHWGNSRKRGSAFHIPWDQLSLRLDKDLEYGQNRDERRLFYVALTRARKKIFLSYSLSSEDGREQIPSQFITEIPEKFIEKVNVAKFEKNLLSHQEKLFEVFNKEDVSKKSLLLSKTYIAELFKRQGLSVSALNNFIECPWKFFFLNLLRLPETISDSGLFGNAIHFALSQYILSLKKNNANKELLLKLFKKELLNQPIDEKDINNFLERGEKALKGYYGERMQTWNKDLISELDIRGVHINNDIILNGKIDMIEPIGKHNFNVYDFKTGEQKSRDVIEGLTKNSNGNYKRQLIFYKILLDRFRNGFFKMSSGIIEFIEPNEKDVFKHEIFLITEEEADQLLKQIIDVGNEIINFSFLNKSCNDKECKYCRLRSFM